MSLELESIPGNITPDNPRTSESVIVGRSGNVGVAIKITGSVSKLRAQAEVLNGPMFNDYELEWTPVQWLVDPSAPTGHIYMNVGDLVPGSNVRFSVYESQGSEDSTIKYSLYSSHNNAEPDLNRVSTSTYTSPTKGIDSWTRPHVVGNDGRVMVVTSQFHKTSVYEIELETCINHHAPDDSSEWASVPGTYVSNVPENKPACITAADLIPGTFVRVRSYSQPTNYPNEPGHFKLTVLTTHMST